MSVSSNTQRTHTNSYHLNRTALIWTLLIAVPVLAIVAFGVLQPVKVRPRMGLAPGYVLNDQAGARTTSEDMRGKLTLYNFTYSHCGEGCAPAEAALQQIQAQAKQWDTAGLPLDLVTITLDPARDDPAALHAYAARLGADPARWHFLTGEPERVKDLVGGGFSVYYTATDGDQLQFDPLFVLVDGNGIVRARYDTLSPDLAAMQRDIGLVAEEVRNTDGPGRLVYEAAHLFMCYPDT